jgi:hypothetical protein
MPRARSIGPVGSPNVAMPCSEPISSKPPACYLPAYHDGASSRPEVTGCGNALASRRPRSCCVSYDGLRLVDGLPLIFPRRSTWQVLYRRPASLNSIAARRGVPGRAYRTRRKRSCGGHALCERRKLGVQLPGGRAELGVAEALHERRRSIIAKSHAPIRAFADDQTAWDVQRRADVVAASWRRSWDSRSCTAALLPGTPSTSGSRCDRGKGSA